MNWKRLALMVGMLIAAGIASAVFSADACAYGGCGMKPLRPLKPIGCSGEMVAICQCDDRGSNCRWVWVCM